MSIGLSWSGKYCDALTVPYSYIVYILQILPKKMLCFCPCPWPKLLETLDASCLGRHQPEHEALGLRALERSVPSGGPRGLAGSWSHRRKGQSTHLVLSRPSASEANDDTALDVLTFQQAVQQLQKGVGPNLFELSGSWDCVGSGHPWQCLGIWVFDALHRWGGQLLSRFSSATGHHWCCLPEPVFVLDCATTHYSAMIAEWSGVSAVLLCLEVQCESPVEVETCIAQQLQACNLLEVKLPFLVGELWKQNQANSARALVDQDTHALALACLECIFHSWQCCPVDEKDRSLEWSFKKRNLWQITMQKKEPPQEYWKSCFLFGVRDHCVLLQAIVLAESCLERFKALDYLVGLAGAHDLDICIEEACCRWGAHLITMLPMLQWLVVKLPFMCLQSGSCRLEDLQVKLDTAFHELEAVCFQVDHGHLCCISLDRAVVNMFVHPGLGLNWKIYWFNMS